MSSHIRIRKSDHSPVPTNIIAQGALPHVTPTDGPSEGPQMEERLTHLQGEFCGPQGLRQATIDKLTDDALLEIFDFYLKENPPQIRAVDEWHALVHVCRRWRNIVFGSPHRLDLRLRCTEKRPVRAALDIWPVLPLEIDSYFRTWEMRDDIIAALEHHDRVRKIALGGVSNPVWEIIVTALRMPFPELTSLQLFSDGRSVPVLPDSFLGGSAPRLRTLGLSGLPFPGVLNLPSSFASDLVDLNLYRLPHSGYISPASMVACLSSLNRLKSLTLGFESPRSRPDQPSSPPQTRVVLPALSYLSFQGMTDYSEHFLARIDTPVLNHLYMEFFMDLVFDTPHFKQFIGRAKGLNPPKEAKLWFYPQFIQLHLRGLTLEVRCDRIDWQLDSMTRICGQLSSFFSSIERLDLIGLILSVASSEVQGKDDTEPTQFLEIFQAFTAIRSLHVSKRLVSFIASALKEFTGESATEVLPNLRDLSLEGSATSGSIQDDIQPFTEARRLSGQPAAVLMATERDYAVELNQFLQDHPAGNLTIFFNWDMKQEGNNNNAIHIAEAKYRHGTYGVGKGRSKGAAKRIAAEKALDHFKAHGVPGTKGAQGG